MKFFLLIIFASISLSSNALVCTASTGNWEYSGTWSCGRVPNCTDLALVIPAGVTVTITSQEDYSGCILPMIITVRGTLIFENGVKLKLPAGSGVDVYGTIVPGGGGGNSNLISVAGTDVWTAGSGTLTGPVAIGTGGSLPIQLLTFQATPEANDVSLNWTTAMEINNHFFSIERSINGIDFDPIKEVNSIAVNGYSNSVLNYFATDAKPLDGLAYYRLKQTDYDGKSTYSPIVSSRFNKGNNVKFTIYPNPNQGEFTIDFSNVEGNNLIEIILSDAIGKQLYKNSYTAPDIGNTIHISPDQEIKKGVYYCTVLIEGVKYASKVIVN